MSNQHIVVQEAKCKRDFAVHYGVTENPECCAIFLHPPRAKEPKNICWLTRHQADVEQGRKLQNVRR